MAPKIYRATPTEKLQVVYMRSHRPLIRFFVSFDGKIEPKALEEAVDLSIEEAPLLSCVFSLTKNRWVQKNFSSREIVKIVSGSAAMDETILSDISFENESPLKVFLIQEGEKDSLCFLVSHLAFDGMALKRYVYLVAESYDFVLRHRNEKKPFGDYSLDRSFRPVLKTLSLRERLSLLSPARKPPKQNIPLPFSEKGDKRPFIASKTISSGRFLSVKAKAKEDDVTINDIVMTAYAFALSFYSERESISFSCPVSFVKELPKRPSPAFSNLTGVFFFDERIEAGSSFSQVLQRVHSSFAKQKGSLDSYRGPFLLSLAFGLLHPSSFAINLVSKIAPAPIVSYSNLGIIEKDAISFGSAKPEKAFISTAVKKAPSFQLSISTFSDDLTMTSSFFGTHSDERLTNEILAKTSDLVLDWAMDEK
ncbi:MAG: condensation domain-containing protein [Bacilli bacterium]|nr:condensation domain-containing protein [Bacilli bacterium]